MNTPILVTTQLRQISPACLGSKEERDAFADRMLAREREEHERLLRMAHNSELYDERMARADIEAEAVPEGRLHVNTRPNRKTD